MKRKLQVFVSSTFTDLIPERQAAVAAILKAGHIPAGMELFTAGDKSQMETIKKWIDESDVYMLILGGRYGSLEPTSSVSYTELEYDYASEQGKPLFAVVINDQALENKVKLNGTAFLEKENQQLLKLFREKVLSNISSFFDDEKDIRLCVHESLSDFVDNPKLIGWVRSDNVEDTKSLHDEIKQLRDENKILKIESESNKNIQPSTAQNKEENYDQLIKILQNIEITIPEKLSSGEETTTDLLSIFLGNKEMLINGVTNSGASSDVSIFLYHNICPKLKVHGLTENEKVTGVAYRRSYVTDRGLALIAECERRITARKTKPKAS